MKEKMDLTKGSIRTHIHRIALPASTGMLFHTLFNVVDTIFAGRIDTLALAGMSLSFPIFFLIIAISSGMGTGTTALLSHALGEKNDQRFHAIFYNATLLGLIVSAVLTLAGRMLAVWLFQRLGAKEITLFYGLQYIHIIFWGSIFFIFNTILNAVLAAQGDTVSYRNFLIFGFFLNLILDPLFIFGWFGLPKLGTAGVALATVIIQAIGTVYMSFKVLTSAHFQEQKLRTCPFSLSMWSDILAQGIPASLNMMTIALGVFVINFYVIEYGGDITVAAYGAAVRIEQLALLPALGLNIAALTITGQNYGARQYERIRQVYLNCLAIGAIIMTTAMVIVYPFAHVFLPLFNDSIDVIQAGTQYLRIEFLCFNTYIFMNVSFSVLQGLKRPKMAVFVGIYRQILMPAIVFFILGKTLQMGILGVWWGIVLINWSAALFTVSYTLKVLRGVKVELS